MCASQVDSAKSCTMCSIQIQFLGDRVAKKRNEACWDANDDTKVQGFHRNLFFFFIN